MKNFLMSKMVMPLVVALSVVAVGQTASAAPFTSETYANWKAGNDVIVGDKVFHWTGDTGNIINAPGVFSTLVFGSLASNEYGLNVLFVGGLEPPTNTAFNGSFSYTVTITDPNTYFDRVELDTTHGGTGVDVFKSEASGLFSTLHSHDGSVDGTGIAANQTVLKVTDLIHIDAQKHPGLLSSITNSFTQVQVPEPSSFLVLSLGLAGFGGLMGLKKRKAKAAAV